MPATLRQGSRGDEVRELQQVLAEGGFYTGAIDGIFGPQTEAAVREFQQYHQITVDGIVGSETWGKFNEFRQWGGKDPNRGDAPAPAEGEGEPAGADENALKQTIREEFPGLAPFLDEPGLGDLLTQAADEGWTSERFLAELRGTDWWKKHTQQQQEWATLSPAERESRINETAVSIVEYAQQQYGRELIGKLPGLNGFSSPDHPHAKKLAREVASGQKTLAEIRYDIRTHALKFPQSIAGVEDLERREQLARRKRRPEEIAEEFWKKARKDYFVNIDKGAAKDWARRVIQGDASFGDFNEFLREEAARLYPNYSESILDGGVLPKSLFAPVFNILGRELEMSEEQIIANDKLWGEITRQAAAAKKDETFTARDWVQYARNLPEWKQTQGAHQMASDFAQTLLQKFGAV